MYEEAPQRDKTVRSFLVFENLDFLTVVELADKLKLKPKTLYNWVSAELIPYVKIGRLVRFVPSEIEKWLAEKGGHSVHRPS